MVSSPLALSRLVPLGAPLVGIAGALAGIVPLAALASRHTSR